MAYNLVTRYEWGATLSESPWMHPECLRQLLARVGDAASCSGKKLMESAGLSWQSLAAWKAGARTPRPENIRAVGHALIVRGDHLRHVGLELIEAAGAEEAERQPASDTWADTEPGLFSPVGLPGVSADAAGLAPEHQAEVEGGEA